MRRTLLRGLALVTAVLGLGLVVVHAGVTAGCSHGITPDTQQPATANPANPTTQAAAPDPAPAKATRATGKGKGKTRYLPATKAAPVFVPDDVDEDDAPPQKGGK
jgi:hypothetical protein